MKNRFTHLIYKTLSLLVLCAVMAINADRARAQVSVTATAGTLGPTVYTTLAAAINAIDAGTHQGIVNISITGNTTETVQSTLNQTGSGGASYASVTIKPFFATTPTITANLGNDVIRILGSNVTIDGSNTAGGTTRDLTIINNTATTTGFVIEIASPSGVLGATNNTIKNCNLEGGGAGSYSIIGVGSGVTAGNPAESPNFNTTIQNNLITNGQDGILYDGNATTGDQSLTITGNTFSTIWRAGIFLFNIVNSNITSNTVTSVTGGSFGAGVQVWAILLESIATNVNIASNNISGVHELVDNNTGAWGIALEANAGSSVNVYNNYISDVAARGSAANVFNNGIGIFVDLGDGYNINFNTVDLTTNQTVVGGFPGAIFLASGLIAGAVNLDDNIFANNQTGGSTQRYAIITGSASTTFTTINYNDYYTNAANMGDYVGVNDATLAALRTSFGSNLNSITYNPAFTGAPNLDLTAVVANNVLNAGTFATTPSITTDIHGTARTNPTIGAYEMISNTITYTALGNTCSNGDITLSGVSIVSGVGVPTAGGTIARIYFRKNAGAWFSNAGTLTAGSGTSGTWSFTITAATMGGVTAGDVISYYVIAQTTGGTVFSNPSTGLVAANVNTVTTPPTTPNTYTVNYVSITGLVTTNSVCFNASAAQTASYAYTGSTGTPNQYTLTWLPAGPTPVTVYAALSSPIVVNIPAGTAANTYSGTLTVQNSTTGCTNTYPITLVVQAAPTAILGTTTICQGATVTLTDVATPGTWSSSNPAAGTIGAASGVLGGVAAGTTNITYTLTSTGCTTTVTATVVTSPGVINGVMSMCQGASTTLTDAVAGGVWGNSPGSGLVSNVGGTITGIGAGTAIVSYSFGGGLCFQTATVTVNASPGAINGTTSVCVGLTTQLTDAIAGGAWSSTNPAAGSIGATGIVTGVGVGGTTTISYIMPGNCYVTTTVTINPAPSAINGTLTVCQGQTTALTNTVGGGVWSSSTAPVGTISTTGVVTGISGGTTTISYTSANCTVVTAVVTVNPVSPILGAPFAVCSGLSINLSDAIGGGTWQSAPATVAIVGSSSGVVTGLSPGTATIINTFTTGCTASVIVTVNLSPVAITGPATLCVGASGNFSDGSAGGTWSSSNPGFGSITAGGIATGVGTGTTTITYSLAAGCVATTTLTVNPVPTAILGTLAICQGSSTTLTDATATGTWASNNPGGMPIGVSSGTVTGIAIGTAIITYALPTGCSALAVLTVNASPPAIAGNHSVCIGSTTTLTDPSGGGTWSSNDPTIGSIGTTSGVLGGISVNTTTITYNLAGCVATTAITVNPLPPAISGTLNSCAGLFTSLSDALAGGTWSSSNAATATIGSSSGLVDALATGTTTVDYTLTTTGCSSGVIFTVNSSPVAITGTTYLCQGTATTFSDGTGGGTWSSSSTNATIGSSSGIVSGVTAGIAIISYILPTGCYSTYVLTITTAPTAISGPSPSAVCVNSAITLSDGVSTGAWSVTPGSGNASISPTGILTGISQGVVVVSYSTFSCTPAVIAVTVNPLPTAIMGVGNLCVGSNTSFSDATPGGAWSSSNATVSVSSAGVVSGVDTGAGTIISYTLPTGCYVTVPVIVFPVPSAILGIDSVCPGDSVTLSDPTAGGIWSSSNGTIAHSIAANGIVEGWSPGNVTISYTLISGCYVAMPFRVLSPVPASLTISQTPDTLLCGNVPVTLIGNSVNGGTPSYEWKLFGSHLAFGDTLTYDPAHADYITCVMTTHNICASPAVVENSLVMNVYPLVSPVVTITTLTTHDTAAYLGEAYTFLAAVTDGGIDPAYQWYVNNAIVPGATNSTFTTHVYDNNDTVVCQVNGTSPCYTGSAIGTSTPSTVIYGLGFLSASSLSTGNNDLTLFPNPNTGSFILSGKLSATSNKDVSLEVTDMLGRIVYTGITTPQNGEVRVEIKLDNDVAGGNYLLRVYTEAGNETFHFVIGK